VMYCDFVDPMRIGIDWVVWLVSTLGWVETVDGFA
jgi:hypothetical protein